MQNDKYLYTGIASDAAGTTGKQINTMYSVNSWPSGKLIAPSRKIVEKNIYPVNDLDKIIAKYLSTPISQPAKNGSNTFSMQLFKKTIKISSPFNGSHTITIYITSGRSIGKPVTFRVSKGELSIPLMGSLSKGLYLVKVRCDYNDISEIRVVTFQG